ncbi:L,D-transpeptidase [Desulfoferrobacter suflitae]|uniref:L,D-transpeptidase n=1 Tax=Desulfoferrobacter suflitae TaxID=2865782 RepID=UPI00216498AE|nr:L,D-transpeptidase [Desulfoferrobacter suflitae]MCK8600520.1 L,D-transpeptidase [Desulfoferrobacter suflitae]
MTSRWVLLPLLLVAVGLSSCGSTRGNTVQRVIHAGSPTAKELSVYRDDPYAADSRETAEQIADSSERDIEEHPRYGWTHRSVDQVELSQLTNHDPHLSYSISKQILARLNVRAPYYIDQDIKRGRPLKVPNDFTLYKDWSPLPREIPEVHNIAKFILIVKDIPFIGWYEYGRLAGDSFICIGKNQGWTRAGIYRVRDKDIDHVSRSYTNAFGVPAPMPWALRIYGHVWIHAGDITGGYCSHGCINLPLMPAQALYAWADFDTVVIITESLGALQTVFHNNRSNCLLYSEACGLRRGTGNI